MNRFPGSIVQKKRVRELADAARLASAPIYTYLHGASRPARQWSSPPLRCNPRVSSCCIRGAGQQSPTGPRRRATPMHPHPPHQEQQDSPRSAE